MSVDNILNLLAKLKNQKDANEGPKEIVSLAERGINVRTYDYENPNSDGLKQCWEDLRKATYDFKLWDVSDPTYQYANYIGYEYIRYVCDLLVYIEACYSKDVISNFDFTEGKIKKDLFFFGLSYLYEKYIEDVKIFRTFNPENTEESKATLDYVMNKYKGIK